MPPFFHRHASFLATSFCVSNVVFGRSIIFIVSVLACKFSLIWGLIFVFMNIWILYLLGNNLKFIFITCLICLCFQCSYKIKEHKKLLRQQAAVEESTSPNSRRGSQPALLPGLSEDSSTIIYFLNIIISGLDLCLLKNRFFKKQQIILVH